MGQGRTTFTVGIVAARAHRSTSQRADGVIRQLDADIETLDRMVANTAEERPLSRLLMTHPGVGPNTALATEVYLEIRRDSPMAKP